MALIESLEATANVEISDAAPVIDSYEIVDIGGSQVQVRVEASD